MGLRKSHPGVYEDVSEGRKSHKSSQSPEAHNSTTSKRDMILNLANMAKGVTADTAIQAATAMETKVPQEIRNEMIKRGFRPSS